MNTNIIGYEGMESAQLEVHMVAATMAQERYIDLKRQSRRALRGIASAGCIWSLPAPPFPRPLPSHPLPPHPPGTHPPPLPRHTMGARAEAQGGMPNQPGSWPFWRPVRPLPPPLPVPPPTPPLPLRDVLQVNSLHSRRSARPSRPCVQGREITG